MTPSTVEAGGVALAYDERGEGPAVVLVHGTATSRRVWAEVVAALGDHVRTIAYDRRAYGGSGAPEPYGGTTVGEQADDLAQLITALGAEPALLCGHELGALACLDLMLRFPELASGAVLIEPPMLWLAATGTDAVGDLREAVAAGAREGGTAGAVHAYLEAVGGPALEDLLGSERTASSLANPRAFAADLGAAASWAAGRKELRSIETPIVLVTGARSLPVRQEATRTLAALLPNARLLELTGGHFAQLEHPQELAQALADAAG